ncbi:MAG: glutathione S-transferase family protein [Actinomycetota bacterium]|nr:glutathione S-transferase family protein [Actinomycetota bacterium]
MKVRLYAVPASHPSACVEAALRLKGLEYERVDLITLLHKPRMRLRFGQSTVPGAVLDGERVVGSRATLQRLEELVPDPPLYPAEGPARERVLEAERWGDEVLQDAVRRISYANLRRRGDALRSYLEGARLALPLWAITLTPGPSIALGARLNNADDATVRGDLATLPAWLDRIDGWIAEGVLGGSAPNGADLQIGASLRLLLTFGDLRPLLEGRPAAELARRYFPDFPGEVPAGTLPPGWLPA